MKKSLISLLILFLFASLNSWSKEPDSSKFSISAGLQTYLPGITEYHRQEYLLTLSSRHKRSEMFISAWVYRPFKSYWRRAVFQFGLRHIYLLKERHRLNAELSYLTTKYTSHMDGVYNINYKFDEGIGDESLILEKVISHNLHITTGYAYSFLKSKKALINFSIGVGIQRNFGEHVPSGILYPDGPSGGYLDPWRIRPLLTVGLSYQLFRN